MLGGLQSTRGHAGTNTIWARSTRQEVKGKREDVSEGGNTKKKG